MNFRELQKNEYAYWDNFVDSSPQGSIYVKSFYLESKDCPFSINIIEQDNIIYGGIVLCKNELGVHSNPLFIKYLGILYADDNILGSRVKRRVSKIDRLIIENLSKIFIFSYSFDPAFSNWLNLYWGNFHQTTKYTYQIHFNDSINFRDEYTSKVKSPINRAKKNQLKIVNINLEDFCAILNKSYKAKNTKAPYKKKNLIRFLNSLINHDCFYFKGVADSEGNIHAVAGLVYDNKSSNLILNGSDPVYREYSGNTLIIDHMIEFASTRSKIFDFEGSMHQRIEHFYFGFGGVLTPYYHIWKNNYFSRFYLRLIALVKKLYK